MKGGSLKMMMGVAAAAMMSGRFGGGMYSGQSYYNNEGSFDQKDIRKARKKRVKIKKRGGK